MKSMKRILPAVLVIIAGTAALRAQSTEGEDSLRHPDTLIPEDPQLTHDAIEYYKTLTAPMEPLKMASYSYIQAITRSRRARMVEKKRQELLKTVEGNKETYVRCEPFNNDSTLRLQLIGYLDLVGTVLKEDFGKILDMEDIEAKSYDQAEAHQLAIDMAVDKMQSSYEVLKQVEKEFFNKYRITMREVKDEIILKIEKANKAIEYHNTINRIFFRANKENAYAREAVGNKDIVGLEQHAMTLVSFADEGLAKLKTTQAYEGDDELLVTARKLLEYYKQEGEVTYPANVEFFIKADNLQRAHKKFNAIKEIDRTQADIDEYNKAVQIYNEAVSESNKTNKESYKRHKQLQDLWKRQVDTFLRKHS